MHEKIKQFIGTRKTYPTIIAANTRIHDTQNFDTRVKL